MRTPDEALTEVPQKPAYVAKPATAEEVADLLTFATAHRVPVAGCPVPRSRSTTVISFERMNAVLDVDTDNLVAVVQPGVTLSQLDAETAAVGLSYTVYPGELSSSIGGNAARTRAGCERSGTA